MSDPKRRLNDNRVRRVLSHGGMAVRRDGQWIIYRGRDRRQTPIGIAISGSIARLKDANKLTRDPVQSDRLIWQGDVPSQTVQSVTPPAHVFTPGARYQAITALQRLLDAEIDLGLRIRLAAAANRYIADIERAATPQSVTMRWDGLPLTRGARGGGGGGLGGAAGAAAHRLEQVRTAMRQEDMPILDQLLVFGGTLGQFAVKLCVRETEALLTARRVLLALAEQYDLVVSPSCAGRP